MEKNVKKIFFTVLFFSFFLGGRELWKINAQLIQPKAMPTKSFLVLKEVLKTPPKEKVEFRFAFDPEFNRLWVSSNLDRKIDLLLQFEALRGEGFECQTHRVSRRRANETALCPH